MKDKIGYIVGLILLIIFFIWMIGDYNKRKNIIQDITKSLSFNNEELTVHIYSSDKIKATKILNEVENIYKDYDSLISNKKIDNLKNIYYLNNMSVNSKAQIDSKLYDMIKYGIDNYSKSNGYININSGFLNELWNKYYNIGIPTDNELKSVNTDIKNIVLLENNTIKQNGFNIDLSYISISYVTNEVINYLVNMGFNSYLINIGDFSFMGTSYNSSSFKIGLLSEDQSYISDIINVNNKAVITLDNTKNAYTYDNIYYHNIINPKTLKPANTKKLTLITSNIKASSLLAYTLFIMGSNSLNLLENDDACIWYNTDNSVIKSPLFDSYLE